MKNPQDIYNTLKKSTQTIPLTIKQEDSNAAINKSLGYRNGLLATGNSIISNKFFCDGFLNQNSTLLPIINKEQNKKDKIIQFRSYEEKDRDREEKEKKKYRKDYIASNKKKYLNEIENNFIKPNKLPKEQYEDNKRNINLKDLSLVMSKNYFYNKLKNQGKDEITSESEISVSSKDDLEDIKKVVTDPGALRVEEFKNMIKSITNKNIKKPKSDSELSDQLNDSFNENHKLVIEETTDRIEYFNQKMRNVGINLLRANKDNSTYMEKLLTKFRETKRTLKTLEEFSITRDFILPSNTDTIEKMMYEAKINLINAREERKKTNRLIEEATIDMKKIRNRFIDLDLECKEKNKLLQNDWDASFALAKYIKGASKPFKTHQKVVKPDIDRVLKIQYHYPLPPKVMKKHEKTVSTYLGNKKVEYDNIFMDLCTDDYFENKDEKDINTIKKKLNYQRRLEVRKTEKQLKQRLYKLKREKVNLTSRNRLRIYIFCNIITLRFRKYWVESGENVKIGMISWYKGIYFTVIDELKKYVYDRIVPVMKLLYSKGSIELDLTGFLNKYSNTEKKPSHNVEKLYSKIRSIIEDMIVNCCYEIKKISIDSRMFLNYIISNNTIVPFKQYSLFEMSRLKEDRGYLVEIAYNKGKMIISIFLFLRILVKKVLVEGIIKDELNSTNKKSLLIVASIIYHSIIEVFRKSELTPKINTEIKKYENYDKYCLNQAHSIKKETELEFDKRMGLSYRRAIANFFMNEKKKLGKGDEVYSTLVSTNDWIDSFGFTKGQKSEEDIEDIEKVLIKRSELETYFNISKHLKYDFVFFLFGVMDQVIEFIAPKDS